MHSKETQEDTGDIVAHVNHDNVHQMGKRRNEPQTGRQTVYVRGTEQREGRAAAVWSSHVLHSILWDWIVQQTKYCSKHPLGLQHMHRGATFHLFNWLQAAWSEERNLFLKALLLSM